MNIFSGIFGGIFRPHRDDLNPSGDPFIDAEKRADAFQKMIAVDPRFKEAYEKARFEGGMIESGTDENGNFYVKHIPHKEMYSHE